MAKVEVKTRPTAASVEGFLNAVEDERQRAEGFRVLEIFRRATDEKAVMWGPAIIGFGSYQIKYADGRELDWPLVGFSPRKGSLSLYVICRSPKQPDLLARLGKHTCGKSCLYVKRLSDIDEKVLEELVADTVRHMRSATRPGAAG